MTNEEIVVARDIISKLCKTIDWDIGEMPKSTPMKIIGNMQHARICIQQSAVILLDLFDKERGTHD